MTYQFLKEDGSPTQESTVLGALEVARTPTVCCVESYSVVWKGDASKVLHEFAVWCAEGVLKTVEDPDPRSFQALRIKRLWLDVEATDEELRIARNAARPVAWFASRDAAWYAAHNAAWDAALDVAWEAAFDAAHNAARAAAWQAVRYASQNAAQNAAWESQNKELEKRLEDLRFPPVRRSRWEALLDEDSV